MQMLVRTDGGKLACLPSKTCKQCDKTFYCLTPKARRRFCSRGCANLYATYMEQAKKMRKIYKLMEVQRNQHQQLRSKWKWLDVDPIFTD